MQNLELGELAERVRAAVVAHAQNLMQQQGSLDAHPPYIVLDLPCTFFMLATHRWGHHTCPPCQSAFAVRTDIAQLPLRCDTDEYPFWCMHVMWRSIPVVVARRCLGLVSKVARSLQFAPQLEQLAARIVSNMTGGGRMPFNGAHLRFEKDAKDWSTIMGGEEVWFSMVP